MSFTSKAFSVQTMSKLQVLLNQYDISYGVESVVNSSNRNLRLKYCLKTRELLIPDFNRQGKHLVCAGFAREAYRLFSDSNIRASIPEVKSMGYIAGSDEIFSGHCAVVLSPVQNSKLGLPVHVNCERNQFVSLYLQQSVIFDLCRKQIKDFSDSRFIAKEFIYETMDIANNPDSVFKLQPRGYAILGDHASYCWGFTLSPHTSYPRLSFDSKNDSFCIYNESDYHRYLSRYPWLSNYMVQNTLKLFCNIQLVDDIEKCRSSETIYYR